jgi:hypothetical protein
MPGQRDQDSYSAGGPFEEGRAKAQADTRAPGLLWVA